MVCKVCNQEVEVGLKVCPFCGASMEDNDAGIIDIQFTDKKAASITDKKAPAPKKTKKGISKKNLIDEAPIKIVDDTYEGNEKSEPNGPIELDFFEPKDDCPTPITVIDNEDEIETIRPLFAKERTKPKKVKGLEREKQPQKPQPKPEPAIEPKKDEEPEAKDEIAQSTEPIVFADTDATTPAEEPQVEEPVMEEPVKEPAEEATEEACEETPAEEAPVEEPVEEIAEEAPIEEPAEDSCEETPAGEPALEEAVEEEPVNEEEVQEPVAEAEPTVEEPTEEQAQESEPVKEEKPAFLPEEIVEEYIAPYTEKKPIVAASEQPVKEQEEIFQAPVEIIPEEIIEEYIEPETEAVIEEPIEEEEPEATLVEEAVEQEPIEEAIEEPILEPEEETVVPELVPANMEEPERETAYEFPPSVVLYEKVSKRKAEREAKPVKDRVNFFVALLSMMFPPYLGALIWVTRSARKPKAANAYGLLTIFSYLIHRVVKNIVAVVSLIALIVGFAFFAYSYVGNALYEAGYILNITIPWM